MGWNTANEYFDSIAQTLIDGGASDELKFKVCDRMIGIFRGGDWDTEDESLREFADDPAIVRAFREHGVIIACDEGHPDEAGSWCVLERNHEDPNHQDDEGRTWGPRPSDAVLLADARALALHCRSIFMEMPVGLDELLGIDDENLPDWFTGDNQGVKLWGGVVDGWR